MCRQVLLCKFVVATILLIGHGAVVGQERDTRMTDLVARVDACNTAKVGESVSEKQERLLGLDRLAKEVEKECRTSDPETYARLTVRICGALHGVDMIDSRRHYIAQHYAMTALEKRADISLDVQCSLVQYVTRNVDAQGQALKGDDLAKLRQQQAVLWLDTWKRIEATIDKDWNPTDMPTLNVLPPEEAELPSGADPAMITDPKLRAQYVADIEANQRKAAEYSIQLKARRLQKSWIPDAKRFLIRTYMESPDKTDELRALLEEYVPNAADRKQILDAVKNKRMPEDLVFKNTTQPARQDR